MTISSQRWVRAVAMAMALAGTIGGTWLVAIRVHERSDPPYCQTARKMIDYTEDQTPSLNELFSISFRPEDEKYKQWHLSVQDWASGVYSDAVHVELQALRAEDQAKQVTDQGVRENMIDKADRVNQTAQVLINNVTDILTFIPDESSQMPYENAPPDENPPPSENPPPWMQRYNRIAANIDLNLDIFELDCPLHKTGFL